VRNYIDLLIFNKSASASGIERESWNTFALQNFFDSYGLGVGLGTVRSSSFPLALLSNVAVPGTVFYLLFIASAFGRRRGSPRTFPTDVRLAARNACLGLIIATFSRPRPSNRVCCFTCSPAWPVPNPSATPKNFRSDPAD
jgi:hypothetical protein